MAKSTEVAVVESAPLAVRDDTDKISQMLNLAIEKGISVDALEKLVTLHERVADRQAASEFAAAMAAFHAECPVIPKKSKVKITPRSGTAYSYTFAELNTIAQTVDPILNPLGLSYHWDSEEKDTAVRAECILTHVGGHSRSSKFSCPVDTQSRMNVSQQRASALTYAKRQALVQVLGLTTADPDTDSNVGATETITEAQVADLDALASEVKADKQRFLKYLEVSRFSEIMARDYSRAVKALEKKRR